MLKSLFKPKSESIDILPPPPPFPTMDLEETEQIFPKTVIPKASSTSSGTTEFQDLLKDLENNGPKQKKLSKKEKARLKKLELKQKKEAKSAKKPQEEHMDDVEKLWLQDFDDFQDLGIDDIGIEFENPPKSRKKASRKRQDIRFPDTLDELDVDYISPQMETAEKQKYGDLAEAQEEIQDAIQKIKKQENASFLGRLFGNFRAKNHEMQNANFGSVEPKMPDKISQIRQKIDESRAALSNLDLEAARNEYIGAMEIYNQLIPEEKAQVYAEIKEAYYERKNAEELKVRL